MVVVVTEAALLHDRLVLGIDFYGPVMEQNLEMVLLLGQPSRLGILWLY